MARFNVKPGQMGRTQNIPRTAGKVSAQAKMLKVNQGFGNRGIGQQQGAMRWLYDTISDTGQTEFEFFKNTSGKTADLTNVDSQNGLLGVGETMTVQYIGFAYVLQSGAPLVWTGFFNMSNSGINASFMMGTFEFWTSNTRTLKPTSNTVFSTDFNIEGQNFSGMYELGTDQVIPPLLPWQCNLSLPAARQAAAANASIRCIIGGVGSILNPKQTY